MAEKFGLNGRKIEKEIWAVFKKIYARPNLLCLIVHAHNSDVPVAVPCHHALSLIRI